MIHRDGRAAKVQRRIPVATNGRRRMDTLLNDAASALRHLLEFPNDDQVAAARETLEHIDRALDEPDSVSYDGGSLDAYEPHPAPWAIFTAAEGEDPRLLCIYMGTRDGVDSVAHEATHEGMPAFFDPHVAPAVFIHGRWWVANHYRIDTHDQLRAALASAGVSP